MRQHRKANAVLSLDGHHSFSIVGTGTQNCLQLHGRHRHVDSAPFGEPLNRP